MGGRFVPSTIRNPDRPGEQWVVTDRHPDILEPVLSTWDGSRWTMKDGTSPEGLFWHEWTCY